MKFFTPSALLAALLVSVVAMLPFLPAAKMRPDTFMLEARISSSVTGTLQIFYDDGAGIREDLSVRTTITASPSPLTYRLALPPGSYKAIRLDPIDRGANVTIASLRTLLPSGRTLTEISLGDFKPTNQIESFRLHDGVLDLVTTPGGNDPQIAAFLPAPLIIRISLRDYLRDALPFVLPAFFVLAAGLFALDRAPRFRTTVAQRARSLANHPARAVWLVGAIAVIASAYPVVFLGRSYVSPNLGTVLLYDTYPTLPGYKSPETTDVKLSDIGAVMWQHVPFSMMQHRSLAQGELPLWNRYNAGGVPLLAQGQSMFGDPVHFLVIAANGAAWAWDLKYLIAKWLFAAGLGLTVLTLTKHRPGPFSPDSPAAASIETLLPALLVTIAAPFVGFFLYRINHPAFFSVCYAPWPLYCLVRIAHTETRRSLAGWCAGLAVANLALMNSGTVKEAYMLLACTNFSGACVLLASGASWRTRLLRFGAVAWTGVIFLLLTAPIWATFLQTLKNAYTGYNAASAYQIQPTLLLGAFDEIFYRPLMSNDFVFSPSLNFLLLLGVLYFLATLRLQFSQRAALALAASSLLPLSLAFGLISPQWIVTLPFLANIAHLDNTFSCALIVLWSVVAGIGFATAARRLGTPEGRQDLIVAGLLLGALVFGWIAFRQAAHRPIYGPIFTVHAPGHVLAINPFIWKYLGSLLVAAALLAVVAQRVAARRRLGAASALLGALCVAAMLWRQGLHERHMGLEPFTARPTTRVDFHARSNAIDYVRAAHAKEPGRGFGFQGNFHPGWTGAYGLETVHGPDALVNPYMRELATVSGVERLWDWRLYVEPAGIKKAQPFFDALNVRFYFEMLSKDPALTPALTLKHGGDLDVYESPTAWPRAFFTDRLDAYDEPAQLIERFRTAAGRPFAAMQRSDKEPVLHAALGQLSADQPTRTVVNATNYRLTENTTSFTVRTSGPGAIVLLDAFWPGDFRAELNGKKYPVVRLNHAFKGVIVDTAGEYRVTFRYWPRNFPRNLALFGVGAVLGLLSFGLAWRQPKPA